MKAELLLSDAFLTMSETVKNLFEEKKRLTDEFKQSAEIFKANIAKIEVEAEQANKEFEAWQESHMAAKAQKK